MVVCLLNKYYAKCLYTPVSAQEFVVETAVPRGRRLVPGITIAIIVLLAVLAFRNGFSIRNPTGLVALENTTMTGNFDITNISVTIPAEHISIRFSAPEPARIITKTNEMNGSGNFWIDDFGGIIAWDGKTLQMVGDMESLNGNQLSIKFTLRQSATIILKAGSIEATNVNMSVRQQ